MNEVPLLVVIIGVPCVALIAFAWGYDLANDQKNNELKGIKEMRRAFEEHQRRKGE